MKDLIDQVIEMNPSLPLKRLDLGAGCVGVGTSLDNRVYAEEQAITNWDMEVRSTDVAEQRPFLTDNELVENIIEYYILLKGQRVPVEVPVDMRTDIIFD